MSDDETKEIEDAAMYTWDEIKKHNKEGDIWIVVHGNVYDVTNFDHPAEGGNAIFFEHAGTDRAEQFESAGHGGFAREQMVSYFIGKVDDGSSMPSSGVPRFENRNSGAIPPESLNVSSNLKWLRNDMRSNEKMYNFKKVGLSAEISLGARKLTEDVLQNIEFSQKRLKTILTMTDIAPYTYEGGMKIWECAIDLSQYLMHLFTANPAFIPRDNVNVLEIGCGHALPTMALLKALLQTDNTNPILQSILTIDEEEKRIDELPNIEASAIAADVTASSSSTLEKKEKKKRFSRKRLFQFGKNKSKKSKSKSKANSKSQKMKPNPGPSPSPAEEVSMDAASSSSSLSSPQLTPQLSGQPSSSINKPRMVVTLQDLNIDVLKHVTLPNLLHNCNDLLVNPKILFNFITGDWSNAFLQTQLLGGVSSNGGYYQLILASETVYCEDQFENFTNVALKMLDRKHGICLIAAKAYYFGLGGGTDAYQLYLKKQFKNAITAGVVHRIEDGMSNIREIVAICYKSSMWNDVVTAQSQKFTYQPSSEQSSDGAFDNNSSPVGVLRF